MNRTLIITLFLLTNIATHTMDKQDMHYDESRPMNEEELLAKNSPWAMSVSMAAFLLDRGRPLQNGVLFNENLTPELMRFYLERGARPLANKWGCTPLHTLSYEAGGLNESHLQKMRMLIGAGVDLCAQLHTGQDKGDTALHIIAKIGNHHAEDEHNCLDYSAHFDCEPRFQPPIPGAESIATIIIDGCKERHQRYQEHFTFLCCLQRVNPSLYRDLRGIRKKYFALRRTDNTSPHKLLSIENKEGQTAYQLWPENEELNPEKYKPVQDAKKE